MPISNTNLICKSLATRMLHCISEYEAIKNKTSDKFRTVKEFCTYHKFSHQNFMKIYNRWLLNPDLSSLVPQKRGTKYNTRRTDLLIEERVLELRKLGNNRTEIVRILRSEGKLISSTTVYNISKRNGLNRLSSSIKSLRRTINRIEMSKPGELLHIDLHQLPKGITIANSNHIYYIVGLIDDFSRVVWLELLDNKQSLNVMFSVLKCFNMLRLGYGIELIDSVITDNGSEFGSGNHSNNKYSHPFERLLIEMDIKHKYTKPYRPQTNGKIERFWKTLKEDFLVDALYENIDDLKNELLRFIVYYNEHRPHSSLNGLTPKEFIMKYYENKNM